MRSGLWPGDWTAALGAGSSDTAAAAAAQSSSLVMSQCRQPLASDIIQSVGSREPYADMLGIHASAAAAATNQTSAEFSDLASMFTGFIE